jgi:hypothetical protein
MGLAGYKTISMGLLIVLVALAGISPIFTQDEAFLTFTPPAACPGGRVTFTLPAVIVTVTVTDIVGGGISVAAMSPLSFLPVLSSDPVGLISEPGCQTVRDTDGFETTCGFVVSESASCGHYTVIVTQSFDEVGRVAFSGPFDVAGPCCPAVGGCVQPVNTFALLSPWLAVIGLVGCVGTVVVVAKKRR